jgi:uncharacterized membrane protein YidH (DUF202 family)
VKNWEAWIIRAGFGFVSASGIVYGAMKYFLPGSSPDSRLGHPWQPAILAAHVLAAPVAVFAMGLLLRGHALPQLKRGEREGRGTGLALTAVGMPLVFSGYLVQVFTGESLRKWTGWIHAAVGLLFAIAFLMHMPGSRPPDDAPETPSETQGHVP